MVAPNEVASLVMAVSAALLVIFVFRKQNIPGFGLIYGAFFFVVLAIFSTLIEGIVWYPFFNTLEHFSHAMAGLVFAAACLRLRRRVS